METPLNVIEKIKDSLKEVIDENNLEYLNGDINFILRIYSADLCGILLDHFPLATIMIDKNHRCCALKIGEDIYDASGVNKSDDFMIAQSQDILFIKKSFPQLSEPVMDELVQKLYSKEKKSSGAYCLRKNYDSMV